MPSVAKYMVRQRKPPSQTCRSFLSNHVQSWHHSPFASRMDRAQLREAFPWDRTPGCLLRDRDRVFGQDFVEQARAMGIKQVLSAPRSPWQRAYVERVIGSIRRECLDHLIVLGEARSAARSLRISPITINREPISRLTKMLRRHVNDKVPRSGE